MGAAAGAGKGGAGPTIEEVDQICDGSTFAPE